MCDSIAGEQERKSESDLPIERKVSLKAFNKIKIHLTLFIPWIFFPSMHVFLCAHMYFYLSLFAARINIH